MVQVEIVQRRPSGYVDELDTEVRDVRYRLDVLSIMESTHVSVGWLHKPLT